MMQYSEIIKSAEDLITSKEQTRAGFIKVALEKGEKAKPYIEKAKFLKFVASQAKSAQDLLFMTDIRDCMLSASGLSEKACDYFDEESKNDAIKALIEKFLEPAGKDFVNELVYRFLLTKGDTIGGEMRNLIGILAQEALVQRFLSVLSTRHINFKLLYKEDKKKKKNNWCKLDYELAFNKSREIYAINWEDRVLFFNAKVPLVNKNIDICLYNCDSKTFDCGNIVKNHKLAIMYGELKGGIDPAGADEHWKTANSALQRIRQAYRDRDSYVKTSFVGAAIERNMAKEIYSQLGRNDLSFAANTTSDDQLSAYCNWIIGL